MHLVDEQDDLALGGLHIVEHALEALFELAAVFGPGDQRSHVERQQAAILQAVGNVAIDDAQRESFGDRGLADAGFADQHRIILGAAREDLDGTADFFVASDYWVELALARDFGEVAGEFLERFIAVFGGCGVGGAATAQVVDRGVEGVGLEPRVGKRLADGCRSRQHHCKQQTLDGDIAVARLGRDLFGLIEQAHRVIVEAGGRLCARSRYGGHLGEQRIDPRDRARRIAAALGDQPRGHAFAVFEQCFRDMLGRNPLMVHADRDRLRGLQEAFGAVGEFFEVHGK